ncbi:hypothetical protein FOL47_007780 [Perkinsus chesapeaki]|uniref:Tubulin polymerization-promoting protein n=1 Tax=Perkinsus chesapeaki TaxID=330153 RepID=A0A7J6LI31_PERCH|nr:hypothetical protein FOL47_007780 [Perkinsus chesapeaki]
MQGLRATETVSAAVAGPDTWAAFEGSSEGEKAITRNIAGNSVGQDAQKVERLGGDTLMEGRQFAKLCKDCELIADKGFTVNDIDIVFAKVRFRGERKIEFGQFMEALDDISRRHGQSVSWAEEKVINSNGPVMNGTTGGTRPFPSALRGPSVADALPPAKSSIKAGSVEKVKRGPERFYYDQSTYTGVWRNGGPKTYDGDHLSLKTMVKSRPSSLAATPTSERPSQAVGRLTVTTPDTGVSKASEASTGTPGCKVRGPARFFYDTSTYTGVHKAGGPEVIDDDVKDLRNIVKRRTATNVKPSEAKAGAVGSGEQSGPKQRGNVKDAPGPERFYYDTKTYTGIHREKIGS